MKQQILVEPISSAVITSFRAKTLLSLYPVLSLYLSVTSGAVLRCWVTAAPDDQSIANAQIDSDDVLV